MGQWAGEAGSVVSTAPSLRIGPPKHLGQTEREQRTPSTQAEAGLAQEREATITFPASRLQTQPSFRRAMTATGDTNGPGSVCL